MYSMMTSGHTVYWTFDERIDFRCSPHKKINKGKKVKKKNKNILSFEAI